MREIPKLKRKPRRPHRPLTWRPFRFLPRILYKPQELDPHDPAYPLPLPHEARIWRDRP